MEFRPVAHWVLRSCNSRAFLLFGHIPPESIELVAEDQGGEGKRRSHTPTTSPEAQAWDIPFEIETKVNTSKNDC